MKDDKSLVRQAVTILENSVIAKGVFEMVVTYPQDFHTPLPGQFVDIYCNHQGRLLPRPISVCEVRQVNSKRFLHLVYAAVGAGTTEFSQMKTGSVVEIMGPLGNGFTLSKGPGTALLVGGGVGTPPMVELAKQLCKNSWNVKSVVGFRDEPYLVKRLEQFGEVFVATDSGKTGFHGNTLELIRSAHMDMDVIYACGPKPMLQGVQEYAKEMSLPAQLSLEERMGCGFGACVGCVVKIVSGSETGFTYHKICKDGPVFPAEEVIFS